MTIKQEEKMHGVVILRLLESISERFPDARFCLLTGKSRSSYSLKGRLLKHGKEPVEFAVGLFIKVSNKRASPWSYSFHRDHQDEFLSLKDTHGEAFAVFVNGDDGVACMDFQRFKQILDDEHEEQEWVRVSRKPNQTYRVSGNDGKLDSPLPRNSFPEIIADYFETLISHA